MKNTNPTNKYLKGPENSIWAFAPVKLAIPWPMHFDSWSASHCKVVPHPTCAFLQCPHMPTICTRLCSALCTIVFLFFLIVKMLAFSQLLLGVKAEDQVTSYFCNYIVVTHLSRLHCWLGAFGLRVRSACNVSNCRLEHVWNHMTANSLSQSAVCPSSIKRMEMLSISIF